MKLGLVDRRTLVPEPDPWADASSAWPRLARLGAAVGPAAWAVDVVLVDDDTMAELNTRWRGGDGTTDVLSFSYLEQTGSGAPDLAAGEEDAARDLWLAAEAGDLEPVIGELVLAPGFVLGRCLEQGWEPAHEWPLLVVHGCLHLLGWEHDDATSRRTMQDREAGILKRHQLPHPLRQRS